MAVIFRTRLFCVFTQHAQHIVCLLPTLLKHTYHVPSSYAFFSMKASVWAGTTPAETSMPTTAVEDNELDTKALSNSSNCQHSTSCASPTLLNDPQAKPECHFLSDNLSDYANFDIREAFWLPPIFTQKTIPGSKDCECTVSYDCSALYRNFPGAFLTSKQIFYVVSSTFSTRLESTLKSVKGWLPRLLSSFYLLVP
jgi:hypothetical protein